ncbi:MAG TPA: hypothetical protein VD886_11930 [Herpetosiphonaceae bacterium]|nr:hypothetical protein [Herpetosiphonaceae bacterium]
MLAPVQAPTTLTFQLVVNDGTTNSVTDTVTITALPPKQQMAPVRIRIPFITR